MAVGRILRRKQEPCRRNRSSAASLRCCGTCPHRPALQPGTKQIGTGPQQHAGSTGQEDCELGLNSTPAARDDANQTRSGSHTRDDSAITWVGPVLHLLLFCKSGLDHEDGRTDGLPYESISRSLISHAISPLHMATSISALRANIGWHGCGSRRRIRRIRRITRRS